MISVQMENAYLSQQITNTVLEVTKFICILKLLALALEGKRTRSSRRRPNSSNYSKLDCSLEEAMASGTTPASVTHVLYWAAKW